MEDYIQLDGKPSPLKFCAQIDRVTIDYDTRRNMFLANRVAIWISPWKEQEILEFTEDADIAGLSEQEIRYGIARLLMTEVKEVSTF